MSPSILRGRADELAVGLAGLNRADKAGEASMVVFSGEPGIGKTAMLRALREQAQRRGFAVGFGTAEEPDQLVPGAPLLLALRSGPNPLIDRRVVEDLARGDAQPLWLADEIVEQLDRRAQSEPVLIVLDDVQWADRLSRFLTRVVAGRLAGSPIVWALATRGEGRCPAGHGSLGTDLDGLRVDRVPLTPLAHQVLIDIAGDVIGAPPEAKVISWLEQIDGNPLLATSLAEGIADYVDGSGRPDLPAGFAERLRARLTTLSPGGVAIAQLTAVWARPLPVIEAAHLLDTSRAVIEDDLAATRAVGLLTAESDAISFRHDLIRDFVTAQIPEIERIRLHQLSAHHIIDSGHPAIEAAPHAAISARASDRRSLDILRRAAADALALVPHTAADLMKQAFEAIPRSDPQWEEVGEQYANALWHAQRGAESIEIIDVLLSGAVSVEVRARLHVLAAQSLWLMGLPEDIAIRTERQLSTSTLDDVHRAQLAASKALALSKVGTPAVAFTAAETALAEARRLRDRSAEVISLHALGEIAKNEGRHAMAYSCFHELRTSLGADFLAHEITSLQHLDRFDAAQALLTQAEDRRKGDSQHSPALASAQVWQHINLGRNDDADVSARALIRLGDEIGNYAHRTDAHSALAIVALVHGDTAQARAIVEGVDASAETDGAPGMLLVRARIAQAEGDIPAARRWLLQLSSRDTAAHTYWSRSLAQLRFSAGVALAANDHEFGQETLHRAVVAAERNPGVPSFQGVALQVRGLLGQDLELLSEAVEIMRNCPRPLMRASAIADYGTALVGSGHREPGIQLLEEALTIYEEIRSPGPIAATRRVLYGAGVRRRRRATPARASSGWDSLTDAERTVAGLIAAGHTNRSAADELTVSANTIGTHLNSVFAKLGVRSRVQLANAMRERRAEVGDQNSSRELR